MVVGVYLGCHQTFTILLRASPGQDVSPLLCPICREVSFLHCPLVAVRLVTHQTGPQRTGQRPGEPGPGRGRSTRSEAGQALV